MLPTHPPRQAMKAFHRRQAVTAFTLVELAAALFLFGLLMVALSRVLVSIRVSERAFEAVALAKVDQPSWVGRTQRLLHIDAENAQEIARGSGDGDLIRFLSHATIVPETEPPSNDGRRRRMSRIEPARVIWRFEAGRNGPSGAEGRLVREVVPLASRDAAARRAEVVAFGVEAATVGSRTEKTDRSRGQPSSPLSPGSADWELRILLQGTRRHGDQEISSDAAEFTFDLGRHGSHHRKAPLR